MLQIVAAGRSLRDAALTLLRGASCTQLREGIAAGGIPLDDLLVALEGDKPVGAVLAVRRAGGMASIWPPAVDDETGPVARELLSSIAARLDAAGTECTQCLLETGETGAGTVMTGCGFPYLSDVLLLTRAPAAPAEIPSLPLHSRAYSSTAKPEFVRVMQDTFTETRDFPALARVRRAESSLAAHRDVDHFDPELWRLFMCGADPAGLLLAVDHPERKVREIAYLGVVPRHRGQGIGRAMLCDAMAHASRSGCEAMEVAVDAGNRYALELYQRLGFTVARRLAVHLRLRPDLVRAAGRESTGYAHARDPREAPPGEM